MEKVFVVSKYVFYSEEDNYSDVLLVCSTEELAKEFVASLNNSKPSDLDVSYSYEEFSVIDYG